MMDANEKSIINTLSYFSVFNYPLTAIELWQYLITDKNDKVSFEAFLNTIARLKNKNALIEKQGFLFFADSEKDIEKRQQNYRDSFAKYEIAKKIVKVFSIIPFVRAVFVCNSLAYNNSCVDGDIDLFIVVKNKRLWLSRFLVLGILKIFHLRPLKNNKKNKIDPTFFINEANLALNDISLNEDIYLRYWLAQLLPIYDPNNLLTKIREQNHELLNKFPNYLPVQPYSRRLVKSGTVVNIVRQILALILNFNFLEKTTKTVQLKIMPQLLKTQLNKNKGVVANEKMIKMHSNDRRQEYYDKWRCLVDRYSNYA